MYASVQDCVDRRGRDKVLLLADDPHADTPEYGALESALEDASDEIDAYVGARHDLPLDPAPRILLRLCVEIGIYRRADSADIASDEMRTRYEDAVRLLKDIQSGKASLGPADPDPPAQAEDPAVQLAAAPRVMGRDSLRRVL